ncbi:MAG: acetyl-CoA carboxylase carboxyl transferase subunit alpha, partial [Fibrobacter sp.]|nr:acetyl-CoA carboxylase carboxyl transferase subunit alpha [Fibrobacter sp.]
MEQLDFEKPIAEMEKAVEKLKHVSTDAKGDLSAQLHELELKLLERKKEVYQNLTSWQTVQVARHPKRPILSDYIQFIFKDFTELHGDRCFGDDQALIGGFAMLG